MSNPAIEAPYSDSPEPPRPDEVTGEIDGDGQAERVFSRSILISAVRCVLTYVIFPFVAPLLPLSDRVGPVSGVIIGTIALLANVYSIKRFHKADHKWKWHMTALNVAVMVLLVILLFLDFRDLLT